MSLRIHKYSHLNQLLLSYFPFMSRKKLIKAGLKSLVRGPTKAHQLHSDKTTTWVRLRDLKEVPITVLPSNDS